ncbi:hypothetical protein ACQKOF_05045 [Lysinibacillus sp. NPDC093190]|uniref:hypothetical protein n=1 Tax=Lysinibacillus sp. NPDC093190 TaxID=3390575 RepID=UPI003D051D62
MSKAKDEIWIYKDQKEKEDLVLLLEQVILWLKLMTVAKVTTKEPRNELVD